MKILCVCTENTCRSPMLECLVRQEIATAKLEGITVASAGTDVALAQAASDHAHSCMATRSLSLEQHTSCSLNDLQIADYEWFLCMTPAHAMTLFDAGVAEDSLFVVNADEEGVADPAGASLADYEACAAVLAQAATEIVASLVHAIEDEA